AFSRRRLVNQEYSAFVGSEIGFSAGTAADDAIGTAVGQVCDRRASARLSPTTAAARRRSTRCDWRRFSQLASVSRGTGGFAARRRPAAAAARRNAEDDHACREF